MGGVTEAKVKTLPKWRDGDGDGDGVIDVDGDGASGRCD